jgi:hypothetical protein
MLSYGLGPQLLRIPRFNLGSAELWRSRVPSDNTTLIGRYEFKNAYD